MSRARTKLAVLFIAACLVIGALRMLHRGGGDPASSAGGGLVEAADDALLDGRFWVEGRPDKLTDYVHGAFFVSRANFGVFERASAYDVRFEFFDLTRSGRDLKIFFPQTKKDTKASFAVKRCTDRPPFDLCLELDANPWGGPKRYYGFDKPEDERAALGDRAARARAFAGERGGPSVEER
jgi:hypothetical protein